MGATAAKALARARGLPLATAPSLLARAAGVAGRPASLVLAVSDALRGEVYAGAFRFGQRSVVTELEPRVWRPDSLAALGLGPDVLVGDVPAAAREVLERATGLAMITPPEGAPRARALIALAGLESGAREVTMSRSGSRSMAGRRKRRPGGRWRMDAPYRIRPAALADAPALVAIERRCFSDPWSEAASARRSRRSGPSRWSRTAVGVRPAT